MKTLHIPCFSLDDPTPVLIENISQLDSYSRVGVVFTVQHLNKVGQLFELLESYGKTVVDAGQLLGCRQDTALDVQYKVDCFLYIGSGRFHPIGLAVKTDKPVYLLNPISRVFDEVGLDEKQGWARKKKARVMRAAAAETFGVMISTKDGQFSLDKAFELKEKIRGIDKKAFLFAGEELSPPNLLPFKVDCWVNTACPRIADDEYEKPVLNPGELEEIFFSN